MAVDTPAKTSHADPTQAAIFVLESVIKGHDIGAWIALRNAPPSQFFEHGGEEYSYSALGVVNAILDSIGADRVAVEFDGTTHQPLAASRWQQPKGEDDGNDGN
jgi:hypothetical protein